ncbi:MAG: ribonuclease III [Gammaproteobacteria bacterium]|nr:ribonuclease III [Gammaproteobacteria bacterium]
MTDDIKRLNKRLNLQFNDLSLLKSALTHRSASAENNERLEFLGDGALNFIIASELFRLLPDASEGDLSRQRANLVRGLTLCEVARDLDLGDYLQLGMGELRSGGFDRDSTLADALEAVIGAIYLDAGFEVCRDFVLKLFESRLQNLPEVFELLDPKTRLQEYMQGRGLLRPTYQTLKSEGKPHEQTFTVECTVGKIDLSCTATGSSRRLAEQAAAVDMLAQLKELGYGEESRKNHS